MLYFVKLICEDMSHYLNKNLCYCNGTMRRAMLVILSLISQHTTHSFRG